MPKNLHLIGFAMEARLEDFLKERFQKLNVNGFFLTGLKLKEVCYKIRYQVRCCSFYTLSMITKNKYLMNELGAICR